LKAEVLGPAAFVFRPRPYPEGQIGSIFRGKPGGQALRTMFVDAMLPEGTPWAAPGHEECDFRRFSAAGKKKKKKAWGRGKSQGAEMSEEGAQLTRWLAERCGSSGRIRRGACWVCLRGCLGKYPIVAPEGHLNQCGPFAGLRGRRLTSRRPLHIRRYLGWAWRQRRRMVQGAAQGQVADLGSTRAKGIATMRGRPDKSPPQAGKIPGG